MSLTVKIGDAATEEIEEAPKKPVISVELNVRKTTDGNLMITDHPEIDIVVMPKNNKIVSFPKERISDKVYDIQDKLFRFLGKKGVINLNSVQGGNVYSSLEATYPDIEGASGLQMVLYTLSKFVKDERNFFNISDQMEREFEEGLTEPDDEDSTELGEVPHGTQKGTVRSGYVYHPYGISSMYRYE